jgi:xanthine dehydrogenase molybdenum-binding subunit
MTEVLKERVLHAPLKYVGQSHSIGDAPLKVTGDMVYGTDLQIPGMLHARLILSPVPHALVKAVDSRRALAVPGVVGVFSHADTAGRVFSRCRLWPDQENCPVDEPIFTDCARFVGDRVAAVVATSHEIATLVTGLVDVDYEELPAAVTVAEALRDGAPEIHPGGNRIDEYEFVAGGEDDVVYPVEGIVTTTTVSTPRTHHGALDPHFCLADYDRSGKLTLWTPCQSVYTVRSVVADLFDLPYNRVRVVKVPVGGSFGGRTEYPLEPVVALLALSLRRPVKLVLDREECLIASYTRPATTTTITTSISRDGLIRSLDADTTVDSGGYASSAPDYALVMTQKTPRLYRLPRIRHRARAVYTNGPVSGGFRGWGAPEICAAVEIHLDLAARQIGIDPVELRLNNLVRPFDIDPVSRMSLGDARVADCLRQGAREFGWAERVRHARDLGRYRRGVGFACGAHKNGLHGEGFQETTTMTLKMNEDGSVTLLASLHELGCGVITMMQIIVGEVLDVDPRTISAGEADTDVTPFDFGTYGSRMTYVAGAAARAAAEEFKAVLLDAATWLMQTPRERLAVRDGHVFDRDDESTNMSFSTIARQARLQLGADIIATTTHLCHSNPGSYSVQFAEVEVDGLTGRTRVTDFLAVGDVGKAVNRGMVEGQFQGAVQMGIGYALCEDMPLDAAGRVPGGGFKSYHMVNAPDMPDVRVLLIEHSGDEGPWGAKSVGEISTVPTAPAVINAINHALGTSICELPASPERVVAALYGQGPPASELTCDGCCA